MAEDFARAQGYYKIDCHVHTPLSLCYMGDGQAEQIVAAALARELDAIAITDHSGFENLDAVRKRAAGAGLTVFAGMELAPREGHVLALFDPDTDVAVLNRLLQAVGIAEADHGDGTAKAREPMEIVVQAIVEHGGIAIPAHIDRYPNGFTETHEHWKTKMRIHASGYLSALEITQPADKLRWNQGEFPDYPKPYACLQSSDAHSLGEIGRRPTYVRLPSLDLAGLRQALAEHWERIVFPNDLARAAED